MFAVVQMLRPSLSRTSKRCWRCWPNLKSRNNKRRPNSIDGIVKPFLVLPFAAAYDPYRAAYAASASYPEGQKTIRAARSRSPADAARPRRRGDRIESLYAVMHESACGTNRTCQPSRLTSAYRVRADIARLSAFVCLGPKADKHRIEILQCTGCLCYLSLGARGGPK